MDNTGFIGKERDAESSLSDHGVRKYDPELGRFTLPDPLWEKYYSFTPWQYSYNNPLRYLDLDGRYIIKDQTLDKKTFDSKMWIIGQTKIGRKTITGIEKSPIPVTFRDYPSEGQTRVIPQFDENKKLIGIDVEMDFETMWMGDRMQDPKNIDGKAAVVMEELKHIYDYLMCKDPYKLHQEWLKQKEKANGDYNKIDLEKAADKAVDQMNKELKAPNKKEEGD